MKLFENVQQNVTSSFLPVDFLYEFLVSLNPYIQPDFTIIFNMKFGYARVSTPTQSLNLQIDALAQYGCEHIYKEIMSGARSERPELLKMLQFVRKGDVIVVWKLDRLGRSLVDLVRIANKLRDAGVQLVSLQDQIDTTTPNGKLTFHLMAALAEFERDMIRERTMAGLEAARARGRFGGRPKGMCKRLKQMAPMVKSLYDDGQLTNREIAENLGVSIGSIYRCIAYVNGKVS